MGKTSAAVKNRYAAKVYDRLVVIVPKGRKADIEAHAAARGQSVSAYISALVMEDMRISPDAWKPSAPENIHSSNMQDDC